MGASDPSDNTLLEHIAKIVGPANLLTGDDRAFYATDVYRAGALPLAVVRPGTVEELQAVVVAAGAARVAMVPRGGGASYTDAYLHTGTRSLTIDTGRLDRIVSIDETDRVVTVEAGVTWAKLHAALTPMGLRTPFFGPFSGIAATVGGSVSQNSISHGTGAHGTSAESVVGIDVVLADGRLLRTGRGRPDKAPFFRFHGPDLTGLFTGDCGVLGVKARITLRLIRRHEPFAAASFGFSSFAAMHAAMSAIAGDRLDDENFAVDAALMQGQIGRNEGTGAKLKMAAGLMRESGNKLKGAATLVKMGLAGTKELAATEFAAHFIVDGVSQAEADAKMAALRAHALKHGAELPNTVPTIVRSFPFAPLTNILGPKGERWVPLHGVLPHSECVAMHEEARAYLDGIAARMAAAKVHTGTMFMAVGASGFIYEPALYWQDERHVFHETVLGAEHVATLPAYAANREGAALVAEIRAALAAMLARHGAAHFQIGKSYPMFAAIDREAGSLLRAIKATLDPHRLMNPGALEL